MAERGCPLEAVQLPAEVRESLAELELELSEGERPGTRTPARLSSQTPAQAPPRLNAIRPPPGAHTRDPDSRPASGARPVAALWVCGLRCGNLDGDDRCVRAGWPAQVRVSARRDRAGCTPACLGFPRETRWSPHLPLGDSWEPGML